MIKMKFDKYSWDTEDWELTKEHFMIIKRVNYRWRKKISDIIKPNHIKFAQRLYDEFDIDDIIPIPIRTYAGHWQASQGAMICTFISKDIVMTYGSQWPFTELIKAKKIFLFDDDFNTITFNVED